jgi:hypothetical protein
VDTNGAGDSYVGGFISGLIANRAINECTKIAAVTAKHVIQQVGATYVAPSIEERAFFLSLPCIEGFSDDCSTDASDGEDDLGLAGLFDKTI